MESISNLSIEELNVLFIEKLNNYDIIFNKYLSKEEIINKKQMIIDNIYSVINQYFSCKNNLPKLDENEIKRDLNLYNSYKNRVNEYKEKESVISTLINDEMEFLDFISLNEKYLSGVVCYKEEKKLFSGINESIKYGILNTLDLTDIGKNETFSYINKEASASILPQIKDSVFLDMQELFKDDLLKAFLLGNGEVIYNKLFHMAMAERFNLSDSDVTNEELINKSMLRVEELSDGIDKSVYKNDESYYKTYIETLKLYKSLEEKIDWNMVDDMIKKQNKGLK